MNRLIIIGASGHGKVVADIAKKCGYTDIVFLDDNQSIKECLGYPVLGAASLISKLEGDVFVAIGDTEIRKNIMQRYEERDFPVLIHPRAVVAEDVMIGIGTIVMAGTVINPGTKIGRGVIVNTSSSIDHDCEVGDYTHVSVGAHLSGQVIVEDNVWIGAGAIISNNVSICGRCLIGAGAVVIRDIVEPGTYVGVPAKRMVVKPNE